MTGHEMSEGFELGTAKSKISDNKILKKRGLSKCSVLKIKHR